MSKPEGQSSCGSSHGSSVYWKAVMPDEFGRTWQWDLVVRKKKKTRTVATVWRNNGNQATWHTWDHNGVGGENSVEHEDTPEKAVQQAKMEASFSAINQGFV